MGNPRVLVIPCPAQGHVIPLMELSLHLTKHGVEVTFVNTEYSHEMVKSSWELRGNATDQIHLVALDLDAGNSFGAISRNIPAKLEKLIDQINASGEYKISCIVADAAIVEVLEIAEKRGIRRALFNPTAAAHFVLGNSIPKLIEDGIIDEDGTPTKKQMIKLSPTMPAMNTAEFWWARMNSIILQEQVFILLVKQKEMVKLADWHLCNSAYELEPAAFEMDPNILPIGPLLARNGLGHSIGSFWQEDSTCLEWLDQKPPRSVVYVSFGSTTVFEPTQFQELALGLELTGRPFLWVVRPGLTNEDRINSEFPLKEFQERVGNQGKMVTWAPQQEVLAHPSTACFVSHCGWNSTMEGLSNGIPFLCWPYFGDQFINRSYISDVWKVGLEIDKDENGMIISRGEINNKVEQLLGDGEIKARALEMKEVVMRGVQKGGTSYQNFIKFVEWIKNAAM